MVVFRQIPTREVVFHLIVAGAVKVCQVLRLRVCDVKCPRVVSRIDTSAGVARAH